MRVACTLPSARFLRLSWRLLLLLPSSVRSALSASANRLPSGLHITLQPLPQLRLMLHHHLGQALGGPHPGLPLPVPAIHLQASSFLYRKGR